MSLFSRFFKDKAGQDPVLKCAAVVAAAGNSARMNGENKLLAQLNGKPVLACTLITLEQSLCIDEIVIVSRSEDFVPFGEIVRQYHIDKVSKIVCGGDSRLQSVYSGICEISKDADLIGIFDAARPLVTEKIIEAAVKAASEFGAAAPAVTVKDTIKMAENRIVTKTPRRENLYAVQTPQVFNGPMIKAALKSAIENGLSITDDCMAAEEFGMTVVLSEGAEENIKITTPLDIKLAEAILAWREED